MKKIIKYVKANPKIFITLLIILFIGLTLRAYHTDYPVIGYHNWKETHYLTEARNFANDGFLANGLFIPANDYPHPYADSNGVHADTFPTTSIITGLAFKIFGASLSVARYVQILFSLGIIAAMFLFVRQLVGRDDVALAAAAITAISPLFVFFSHNVQLMNPGLFFMLLGAYYYLKWIDDFTKRNANLTALFIALSILTKFTYVLILFPMLVIFPFDKLKEMLKNIKD